LGLSLPASQGIADAIKDVFGCGAIVLDLAVPARRDSRAQNR
jgi:hypothetical protein